MTRSDTDEIVAALATALREAMESDPNNPDLARHIARALVEAGATIDIVSDDTWDEDISDDDLPRSRRVATTQLHRLMVDDVEIATLEREGVSYYGDPDHPDTPCGEWITNAGESDCQPTSAWLAVADVCELSGDWEYPPVADEDEEIEPTTDDEGAYCLWWTTVGDDDRPLTDTRYASLSDALAAQQLAQHALHCRHRGTLLCGYDIGVLVGGTWERYSEETEQ